MDITYVPMARGFVYLVAVVDWFSRKVLAWRLSVTLETGPCVDAQKRIPHCAFLHAAACKCPRQRAGAVFL